MGTLSLMRPDGTTAWSMAGNQGDVWTSASAEIAAKSFKFFYVGGNNYDGDAAFTDVMVKCYKYASWLGKAKTLKKKLSLFKKH
jgi:hypothetical protein